jgi:hypothetical protein
MELFAACFQQLDVARRVDGVAELGVLPLGQVELVGSGGAGPRFAKLLWLLLLWLELIRHTFQFRPEFTDKS